MRCGQHGVAAERREDWIGAGERFGRRRCPARRRAEHRGDPLGPLRHRPVVVGLALGAVEALAWRRDRRTGRRSTWRGRRSRHTNGRRCRARRNGRRRAAGASAAPRRSQKPAPLSGGPPSPNVLVTISTSRAAASRDSGTSSMLTSWESPSRRASRAAKSSALPVCDAHTTSGPPPTPQPPGAGRDRSGRRALTAHTLNSGCRESGSTASLVSALIVRYSPCSSFQWNGTKQFPGRTRSVTTAGSTARPRRDVSSTGWPSTMPIATASDGVDLDERPAVELVQLGDLAGLGHRVPLVLQPTRVEHQREIVVGQLVRIHVRARVEHRPPRRSRKGRPGPMSVGVDEQVLADPVVEVADRMAVPVVVGWAGPLQGCLPKPRIADPAQVVAGLRVGELAGSRRIPARWTRNRSPHRSPCARRPDRSAASPGGPARRAGWTPAAE